MRLRPLSLLLAPLWLLLAISILVSCTPHDASPGPVGGGVATGSVATVMPELTSMPGVIGGTSFIPPPLPETPIPTLSSGLSPAELKYRVLAKYPQFFFCDPDYYPVARADEMDAARQRFPEIESNREEFETILAHNGLGGLTTLSDDQKLLIYREHKKLAALYFELAGGKYQFQLTSGAEGQESFSITGTIDANGQIQELQKTPGFATCPICLAAQTRIDTASGPVLVEDLQVGDSIWTMNPGGERIAEPILRVVRVPVSKGHVLVHLRLEDGRELWASPGHPTADGRRLGKLEVGDLLDGSRVSLIEQVSYEGTATYDVLPAGGTGYYWADGVLIGSTLGK